MIARRFLALVCAHHKQFGRSPADNDRLAITIAGPIRLFVGTFRCLRRCGKPLLRRCARSSVHPTAHLLRVLVNHQNSGFGDEPATEIGERNRKSRTQSRSTSSVQQNASTSDRGSAAVHSTRARRRARAILQNGVLGTWSHQNACHRVMVAASTPKSLESSPTRRGVGPWRIALIKTTTAPR